MITKNNSTREEWNVVKGSDNQLNSDYINKLKYIYNVFDTRLLNPQDSTAVRTVSYLFLDLDLNILILPVHVLPLLDTLEVFL